MLKGINKSASIGKGLERLAAHPRRAALALLLLCLAVYLPGVVRLPPVDRTEVIYAETTRGMVASGNWFDPRYGDVVHPFRPIGTYWAQAISAALAGLAHARDIAVYRLPGLIAVGLSVLALFWLAAPLVGTTQAMIAAMLFAVAPLTVLLSQLAITEGLALLPAVVAMLCLLRIYVDDVTAGTPRLAALFWISAGIGMLLNALQTPILVAATLIALWLMDRDLSWVRRLGIVIGLPVALLIASPWLIVRAHQDGVPFSGMGWSEFLAALGGSQDMKLRAFPGTFVLAALLGFLPGTALLAPVMLKLWKGRGEKIARFLLAWVLGYIVYLEAISSKPGTYTVQVMFPAFALAAAMLVAAEDNKMPPPKWHAMPWPPLAALFAAALFAVPYVIVSEAPPPWLWPFIAAVAALFYVSAREGRCGRLTHWALAGTAALALFAVTLLGGVLPSIDKLWPARQIQRAIAACPASALSVLGYNEPSSHFVLDADPALSTREGIAKIADGAAPGLAIISDGWYEQNPRALTREQKTKIRPLACVRAINTMRGCTLALTVVVPAGAASCAVPPGFDCIDVFTANAKGPRGLKACD